MTDICRPDQRPSIRSVVQATRSLLEAVQVLCGLYPATPPEAVIRAVKDMKEESKNARNAGVNGGAKLVHPGGAKLVHLMLCGTRCWGVVPVVHRRDPRCFV